MERKTRWEIGMDSRLADSRSRAAISICTLAIFAVPAEGGEFRSHSPQRPLAVASQRPISPGLGLYVDPQSGNDANEGTRESPWRTIQHAAGRLETGDVLYLRGGVYYEHVTLNARGTSEKPITVRSVRGELAVIDGGLREFYETPAAAWEPVAGGADGEFRSTKTYPDLGGREGATNVLGNFGDSMIPLHGYRYITDLRSENEYFSALNAGKTEAGAGVYCGPGVFYDVTTERIHVRLSHTRQKALGEDNYHGETDPRKLRLVIAGLNAGPVLSIDGARYVRIQDVVVRGARTATVSVSNGLNVEFDGVTMYGGSSAMAVGDSIGLRLWNCALRGIAAPWTYRGSLKYRAIEARIFSASGWAPTGDDNHDFELAHSEFTDCVDGVFIGNVKNVRFHHNLLDNISDDGIFLTSTTAYDGTTPGGNIHIYQNLLSRCLTTFAFGVGHGRQKMTPSGRQTGAGVFIYRNVFDFRRPVMYAQPEEGEMQITSYGRVSADHGGPLWEPMTIYHNTILQRESPFRGYYLAGLGGHLGGGSMRRLFNNIVVHADGRPGSVLPPVVTPESTRPAPQEKPKKPADPLADLLDGDVKAKNRKKLSTKGDAAELAKLRRELDEKAKPRPPLPIDFRADANLHWNYADPPDPDDLLSRFTSSSAFADSKKLYPPGWTAHDVVADPQFVMFNADWRAAVDPRLKPGSPARESGVAIPPDWPDPLRAADRAQPDIGAIPVGTEPWRVGVRARLTVFGRLSPAALLLSTTPESAASPTGFLVPSDQVPNQRPPTGKPIMIVQGYPAFDAPLMRYVANRRDIPIENLQRTWLDPADYSKHRAVVIVGNLARARIEPHKFSPDDLQQLRQYLNGGGKLVLMRGNTALFSSKHGSTFLSELTGASRGNSERFEILKPRHAWLKHLDRKHTFAWLNARHMQPIRVSKGEMIIGSRAGFATLYRAGIGRGELIYFGWDVASSMPHGRSASTVEQEIAYEQQMQILSNVIESIAATLQP
jgi:hypothetical protein